MFAPRMLRRTTNIVAAQHVSRDLRESDLLHRARFLRCVRQAGSLPEEVRRCQSLTELGQLALGLHQAARYMQSVRMNQQDIPKRCLRQGIESAGQYVARDRPNSSQRSGGRLADGEDDPAGTRHWHGVYQRALARLRVFLQQCIHSWTVLPFPSRVRVLD